MPQSDSIELVINLHGDGQVAAERIEQALEDNPDPGLLTPRLMGRVAFPAVSIWRARSPAIRVPFARFDGSIQQMGEGAVLAGRVYVAEPIRFLAGFFAVFTGLFVVLLIASVIAAGTLVAVLTLISFFAVTAAYLYVSRRVKHASSATEAELLIQELREFVAKSQELDS